MRALPVLILVLSLTGCSWFHTSETRHTATPVNSGNPFKDSPSPTHKAASRAASAKLYKNAEQLVGKPFRDLGEVSGSTCQVSLQDPPPSLAAARKDMQQRAGAMKGNAVLLHRCEMVRAVAGCYQQAVCQGTALSVSQ